MDQLDNVILTSPNIDLLSYPNPDVGNMDKIIEMMIGCLQRVKTYPEQGFQIAQDIPVLFIRSPQLPPSRDIV
jgi:hypothetical protein